MAPPEQEATEEYHKKILTEFSRDPANVRVMNEFFELLFRRGQINKTFVATAHGRVKVIRDGLLDERGRGQENSGVNLFEGCPDILKFLASVKAVVAKANKEGGPDDDDYTRIVEMLQMDRSFEWLK